MNAPPWPDSQPMRPAPVEPLYGALLDVSMRWVGDCFSPPLNSEEPMGLFSKRAGPPAEDPDAWAPLGGGRSLATQSSVDVLLESLAEVLRAYGQPRYKHLPLTFGVPCKWSGQGPAPEATLWCQDSTNEPTLLALWPHGEGTTLAVVPLGNADGNGDRVLVEDWQRKMPMLKDAGTLQKGSLGLGAPKTPDDYVGSTLDAGGRSRTPFNTKLITEELMKMMLIKASSFINHTEGQVAARRFVDEHRAAGGQPDLDSVLADLAVRGRRHGYLPHIQPVPWRTRAVLLDVAPEPGSIWEKCDA